MKYKKIITSGCSFSDPTTPYSWPNQLEKYLYRIDQKVKVAHRGMSSQGQELIQKKSIYAIEEAINEGYKPEEICLFVMWTSNDRKSFFVDNPDFINDLVENWKKSSQGWQFQLADLKNEIAEREIVKTRAAGYNEIPYNKQGGWLITSCHVADDIKMVRDYFMMSLHANSVGCVHTSLENIILLQTYCKLKNIKLYQQFTIPFTMEDFEIHKNHQAINYLYKQLDQSTFISTKSMYNYLENNPEYFKGAGDKHPNGLGHRIWLNEVILPYLQTDGFLEDI